ncbi:MAG: hypothetical protein C4322_19720 [Mastigocladus sp. ERB_26_1]
MDFGFWIGNLWILDFGFCEKFVDARRLPFRVLELGAYSYLEAEKAGIYKAASRREPPHPTP